MAAICGLKAFLLKPTVTRVDRCAGRRLSSRRHGTDSELRPDAGLFHRTKLNFAGAQRDYFIIMITEVPVRSYGPIYSSKMSRYE